MLFFRMGQPQLLFVYFRSFQTQIYRKTTGFRGIWTRIVRRQACWPLNHHHGPVRSLNSYYVLYCLSRKINFLDWKRSLKIWKSSRKLQKDISTGNSILNQRNYRSKRRFIDEGRRPSCMTSTCLYVPHLVHEGQREDVVVIDLLRAKSFLMGQPRPLFHIFRLFKQIIQFCNKLMCKISIQY